MNLVIKILLLTSIICFFQSVLAENFQQSFLLEKIHQSGYLPPEATHVQTNSSLAKVGKSFFESENLSLNSNISCSTCHFDEKSSADGIPIAAGISGQGKGIERLMTGGKLLPRNTIALWGVGGKGFNTFFWDGRVDFSQETKISQFGSKQPDEDPLITAVHLPAVEIRETVTEDNFISKYKLENVDSASIVYQAILDNLKKTETDAILKLSQSLGKEIETLEFKDVAKAIAEFIRSEFKVRESTFSRFVKGQVSLNEDQIKGGILFYGKGGCGYCHSGPYLSNHKFYTIPFPQLGFGKNGFGIDYGRYNATFNTADLYKFRTPSLLNIGNTSPYGHSGSLSSLKETVVTHFDPLSLVDLSETTRLERHELYKYLAMTDTIGVINFLSDEEVNLIVSFLRTFNFNE